MTNQYYYHNHFCRAETSDEPDCICWQNEGTGPFPDARPDDDGGLEWRKAPDGPLNALAKELHQDSKDRGWWAEVDELVALGDLLATDEKIKFLNYLVGTKFSLIHSEVSEALEGFRKDSFDDHLPHRQSVEVELADAVIRILDLAGYLELDLDGALAEKRGYNKIRADHDPEARKSAGGKRF